MKTTTANARLLSLPLRILTSPLVWLERTRGRWRLALAALYTLILAVAGLLTWRAFSLNGLPDVGDPFDAEAFEDVAIPDDRNAFRLYERASAMLKQLPSAEVRAGSLRNHDWATAAPEIRAWVEQNRGALDLFVRG